MNGNNCECDCGPTVDPEIRRTQALLWQAERARAELLREKIKKAYDKRRGPVLDKAADALAAYLERTAKADADETAAFGDLQDKLKAVLEGGKK